MTGSVMRRRASLVGLLVLLCLLPVFVPAHAASGGLDPAFGTSGEVTTPFGGAGAAATVVQQADGKLVAVGAAAVASAGQVGFGVARYNSDGSLDPTFGPGGTVTTGFGDDVAVASAVTVLADGRILVAGFGLRSDGTDIVLARYTPLGVLDPSFGAGTGTVTTPKGADELTTSLVLRPDGTFVVAGGDSADFVLAGYTADGTLDSTFGTAGFAVTPLAEPAGASAVALQPDGKLVAAGTAGGDVGVVRYNPNGSLHTALGAGTGQATTDFGARDDARRAAVPPHAPPAT